MQNRENDLERERERCRLLNAWKQRFWKGGTRTAGATRKI